jgi:putative tributyrin esterase
MPLIDLHFFSQILGKQTACRVLLPPQGLKPPYAVHYLLHGLSDDHTIWSRRSRIEHYLEGLNAPLMIVMPDGHRGFYTDHTPPPAASPEIRTALKYGTHIGLELVDFIDQTFRTRAERSARSIGGLSMGGYGALRTALAHPDRFVSAHSHSGAVLHGSRRWDTPVEWLTETHTIFGLDPRGTHHDLLQLARSVPAKRRPALHVDCGTADFLLEDNRTFHQKLAALRYPHAYIEHDGAHDWDYWDIHIRDALAFHLKQMGLRK